MEFIGIGLPLSVLLFYQICAEKSSIILYFLQFFIYYITIIYYNSNRGRGQGSVYFRNGKEVKRVMIYVITAAFIVLDMLTGLVKAFKEKSYCSSVMREGLFHKVGSILCVAFATLIDYAQCFLDLGVAVPVTEGVCVYIVLMEIGSVIENVCAINPEIMPDKLKMYFKKLSNPEN